MKFEQDVSLYFSSAHTPLSFQRTYLHFALMSDFVSSNATDLAKCRKLWHCGTMQPRYESRRNLHCFKCLKCFQKCKGLFLSRTCRQYHTLSQSERLSFLEYLPGSDVTFSLEGHLVCVSSMEWSLHLLQTLQSDVKYGTVPMRTARWGANAKDSTVSFLKHLASFFWTKAEIRVGVLYHFFKRKMCTAYSSQTFTCYTVHAPHHPQCHIFLQRGNWIALKLV